MRMAWCCQRLDGHVLLSALPTRFEICWWLGQVIQVLFLGHRLTLEKTYLQFWWVITTIASSALNHEQVIIVACWLKLFKKNIPTNGVDGAVAQLWTGRVIASPLSHSKLQLIGGSVRQTVLWRPYPHFPKSGTDGAAMKGNSRLCTCIRPLLSLFLEGTEVGYPRRQQQFSNFSNLCVWSIYRRPPGPTSSSFPSWQMVGLTKRGGEPLAPAGWGTGVGRVWAGCGVFVITAQSLSAGGGGGGGVEPRSITANNTAGEGKKVEMYMFVQRLFTIILSPE